ncbi:hypothetical protein ARAM_007706, partial [Aspergillus rambellii]
MGTTASKPARSAAQAVSRRQYPKQPTVPRPPHKRKAQQHQHRPLRHQTPENQSLLLPRQGDNNTGLENKHQPSNHHVCLDPTNQPPIDLDGRDPDFAASLRSIGPVTPVPTFSHSSTFGQPPPQLAGKTVFPPASNPALLVVTARHRITKEAEQEVEAVGRGSFVGREYLDAFTIRQILSMRDKQGLGPEEIERVL